MRLVLIEKVKTMKLLLTVVFCCQLGWVQAADTPTLSPPETIDHLAQARAAIAKKNWNGALVALQAALKQEPRNADVYNLLGYTYRKQATPDLNKAFEHYKKALEINPKHRGAHEYIGEAYLMSRNPEQAKKHLDALESICGNKTCEEYADLAKSLAAYRKNNPS